MNGEYIAVMHQPVAPACPPPADTSGRAALPPPRPSKPPLKLKMSHESAPTGIDAETRLVNLKKLIRETADKLGVATYNRTAEQVVERMGEKYDAILKNLEAALAGFKLNLPPEAKKDISEFTNRLTGVVAAVIRAIDDISAQFEGCQQGRGVQEAALWIKNEVKQLAGGKDENKKRQGPEQVSFEMSRLRAEVKGLEAKVKKAERSALEERQRYNELLGLKIRQDKRTFQDLNDGGRPEVVIRKYQDIANDVRLDAADELDDQYGMQGIESLKVLCDVMKASWEKAEDIVQEINADVMNCITTGKALGEGLQMEIHHELKAVDKTPFHTRIAEAVTEDFRTIYKGFAARGGEVESYVVACAEVAWMIVLTSPPMALVTDVKVPFDPKRHKLYSDCRSKPGAKVTFVLWPGLAFDTNETPEEKPVVVTELPELSALIRSQEKRRSNRNSKPEGDSPPSELDPLIEDEQPPIDPRRDYSPVVTSFGQRMGDSSGKPESTV